jgi:hypothetical protein
MSDDQLHDVRLVKHHLRRNKIDTASHQAWLDTLEDVADLGEPTVTRFQSAETRESDDDEAEAPAD